MTTNKQLTKHICSCKFLIYILFVQFQCKNAAWFTLELKLLLHFHIDFSFSHTQFRSVLCLLFCQCLHKTQNLTSSPGLRNDTNNWPCNSCNKAKPSNRATRQSLWLTPGPWLLSCLYQMYFPALSNIKYLEWWAHESPRMKPNKIS